MFRWNHAQVLRNNQTFNANTTYSSNGNYNRKYGLDIAQRMDQKAISNVTYTKRWPSSKNSISLNLYSNQDLLVDKKIDNTSNYYIRPTQEGSQLNIVNRTLPKISFRRGQGNLIPTKNDQKKWYNNITWNYGFNFSNKDRKYYESVFVDSLNDYDWKRDENGNALDTIFIDNGWTHTASINAPTKLFKYININPSVRIRSSWVNRTFDKQWDDSTNNFQNIEVKDFATRTTGSFSLNANTKLYGVFAVPIGPIKVIRHVASPSIGFSWTPDFSKPFFGKDLGYFQMKTDPYNGNEILHDRFSGTMAGSTPRSEQKNVNFSLNNIFQAKIVDGDNEKKQDLFSWRMSTGRNFVAEDFQWNNINSSIRANISRKLNLDFSMTHDWYDFDKKNNMRINTFKTNNGLPSPRLINARFSTGFRFSGKRLSYEPEDEEVIDDTTNTDQRVDGANLANMFSSPGAIGGNTAPSGDLWSTSASFSFSYNNVNPNNPQKTFWMSSNSTIQFTEAWKIQYNARFDLINQDLVSQTFSIYRDLHCWELSLNWTPGGYASGLYLKLNVKSPNLRDLRFEQRGGTFSRPSLFDR